MGGEGGSRGWDGWIVSLTQWTWVWVNSRRWWWTGKPGMLQSMVSQGVRHDWPTELNWSIATLPCSHEHIRVNVETPRQVPVVGGVQRDQKPGCQRPGSWCGGVRGQGEWKSGTPQSEQWIPGALAGRPQVGAALRATHQWPEGLQLKAEIRRRTHPEVSITQQKREAGENPCAHSETEGKERVLGLGPLFRKCTHTAYAE